MMTTYLFKDFKPEGKWSSFFTWLMKPLMYWLQGICTEEPQATHFWNNIKYWPKSVTIEEPKSVFVAGDCNAVKHRWFCLLPIFHIPRFGGWRKYVVIEPINENKEWFIGWECPDVLGISQIPVCGQVRVLIGFGDTRFFGINRDGVQISLAEVGRGTIGDGSEFKCLPLR